MDANFGINDAELPHQSKTTPPVTNIQPVTTMTDGRTDGQMESTAVTHWFTPGAPDTVTRNTKSNQRNNLNLRLTDGQNAKVKPQHTHTHTDRPA